MEEVFVGEELIRISLEMHEIHITFTDTVLQIGSNFLLRSDGGITAIYPIQRRGDVQILWTLLGQTITKVDWREAITLVFERGAVMEIPPTPGKIRGTIQGRRKVNDMLIFEDF